MRTKNEINVQCSMFSRDTACATHFEVRAPGGNNCIFSPGQCRLLSLCQHRPFLCFHRKVQPAVEGQANVQQQQKNPRNQQTKQFQYRDGHLLAWRAYGIGIGKRVVDKGTGTIAIINTRWASSIGNLKVIKLFSYWCLFGD